MDDKLQEIQRNIDSTEAAIQAGGVSQAQIDVWNMQVADFNAQKAELIAERQAMDSQLAEAKVNGYIFDTLKSGDYSMAELAATPAEYVLQCIEVQKLFLEQQGTFNKALSEKQDYYDAQAALAQKKDQDYSQLALENQDLTNKLKNATDIIAEKDIEIATLKANQAIPTVSEIAPLTAEEQDAQWKATNEKLNNRTKVTGIRLVDQSGVDTRKSIATLALGGEEEFDTVYKSRYVIISESDADQLKADYAQKKADIEASNSIIPLSPVSEEPAEQVVSQDDFRNADTASEQSPVVQQGTDNPEQTGGENADTAVQTESAVTRFEFEKRVGQLEIYVAQLNHKAGLIPADDEAA